VVSLNLTANKIEAPSLSRDDNTQRQGDGSFDRELEAAKNKLLVAPWAEVQKMFNITPLEFKFDFNANKIENEVQKDTREPQQVKTDRAKSETGKETKTAELPKTAAMIKISKDTLAKNIPLPVSPFAFPASYLGDNASLPVTKSDMKMVIDDIVEKIELMKVGRRSELNMALNYENLGDLLLNLTLKDGMVSIQISAAQNDTKKSLEQNLSELESALKSAKINLKDLTVTEVKDGDQSKHPG